MAMEKPKVNRRNAVIATIAGVTGVLSAPILSRLVTFGKSTKSLDLEKITGKNVIEEIQKAKKIFEAEGKKFWDRVNAKVLRDPENRSRIQYAQDAFLYTKAKNISPKIQAKLGVIIPGLAAQESKFDAALVNKRSGAYGTW